MPSIRWSSTDTKEPKTEPEAPEVDELGDVIPPEMDATTTKILGLEKEVRDLKDRVVRSLAEEENVSTASCLFISPSDKRVKE